MKRLSGIGQDGLARGGFLSIGNFDGVHRGHQTILRTLCQLARQHSVPAVVMTFEPHPIALLKPEHTPPRLTTPDERARLLAEQGVDVVLDYPTDWSLLRLTPEQFFRQIVMEQLGARGVVEGPNFYFGHRRAGTVETLRNLCLENGLQIDIVPPLQEEGEPVSSSAVRRALLSTRVEFAATLLGRPYAMEGTVVRGAERGRQLGFPTANLDGIRTLVPGEGVYAASCWTDSGKYFAAVNVGPNPTFEDQQPKVEAHLLDFSGDLYGQAIRVEFLEFIRLLRKFPSAEELQKQIGEDVAAVRRRAGTE